MPGTPPRCAATPTVHAYERLQLLAVAVASLLVCLPFIRQVFWIGDEGILVRAATELSRGGVLYRDDFEILPPVPFLLTAGWFKVFGATVASMRGLSTTLLVLNAVLAVSAARRVSGSVALSAGLALLWVVASQGTLSQVNHHLFTTAFSLAALNVALDGRMAAAGVFGGLAAMTTPQRGALALLAALSSVRAWREAVRFAAGVSVVLLVCLARLIALGTIGPFWADVVVWNTTQYSGIQALRFGYDVTARDWLFKAAYPAAAVLAAGAAFWRRSLRLDRTFLTTSAFAAAGFMGSFPRPDMMHLLATAPLALPLFALCVVRLTEGWSRQGRMALALLMAVQSIPMVLDFGRFAQEAMAKPLKATPAGLATFTEPGVAQLSRIVTSLPPGGVYFYPYMPLAAFLSRRPHVGTVDILLPGYTSPAQYAQACREVSARAQWVVFDRLWTSAAKLRAVFPAMRQIAPPERVAFEQAIAVGFAPAWRNQRFVVMGRRLGSRMPCR